MSTNTGENIRTKEIEYTYLALMSHKLRVGIIGGGKAGFIKAKNFIEKGCYVEILSKTFLNEFINIECDNIVLNKRSYNKNFIEDKHIIILALDDNKLREEISSNCEELFKIFIDCSNFKEGMAVVPVQREISNISFALSTKVGNPKGAVLAAEAAMETLKGYDDFIEYTGLIRNKAKNLDYNKKEIIDFISTEDFKFIWEKNKSELALKLFFGKYIIEKLDMR
ncbi:NAD(P)-dependent oxidoreductase [Clostridium gasigenes]|uniref:NAD(P)-dependent oxidoreductase n=1 Tax=Clostridium gasigenes TaxID=94869 RepID=UPI001C0E1C84|nr:NAD(P)-dependent oxidoreductase [Clostridium gasigenes]MBU3106146.1 NAD(P)-dependent oxidoreductase [Clostridium gasigenes]